MGTGFIVLLVAAVVVSIVVGLLVGIRIGETKSRPQELQGTIYVYGNGLNRDPYLFLEYGVPIADIASRETVTFEVRTTR